MKDESYSIKKEVALWDKKFITKNTKFEDEFNIEGISLWWFLYPRLILFELPKPFVRGDDIEDFVKKRNKNKPIYKTIISQIIKRYLYYNHKLKINWLTSNKIKINNKDVVLITYKKHIKTKNNKIESIYRINKILENLRKENLKHSILICEEITQSFLKGNIKFSETFYDFVNKKIIKKANIEASRLNKKWKNLDLDKKKELFSVKDVCVFDFIKTDLNFLFSKQFLEILLTYYYTFKSIFYQRKNKVLVVTSHHGLIEKCAMAAANNMGINSIIVQSCMEMGTFPNIILPKCLFAVFGEADKKKFIKIGVKEESILIVGPIIFDEIIKYKKEKKKKEKKKKEKKKKEKKKKEKKKKEKKILVVTCPFIEDSHLSKKKYLRIMEQVLSQIKNVKNVKAKLKPHPRELHIEKYVDIFNKIGFKNAKVFETNISRDEFYKLIKECDVFVNMGSTSAIEAMIIDRPIVTVNLLDNDFMTGWIEKENLTIHLDYKCDVKNAIEKAMKDELFFKKKRKKYIKNLLGVVDGKASERVTGLIKDILKNYRTAIIVKTKGLSGKMEDNM